MIKNPLNYQITSNAKDFESLMRDETLFVNANGSLGSKNHFAEGYGSYDYPVTLRNGFYNTYAFHYEENYKQFPQVGETIVNLPDSTRVEITFNHEVVDRSNMTLVSVNRTLDMLSGVVTRVAIYQKAELEVLIKEEKILDNTSDTLIQRITFEANQKGILQLNSQLRMPRLAVSKSYDPRLAHAKKHLNLIALTCEERFGKMTVETTNTKKRLEVTVLHDKPFTYHAKPDAIHAIYEVPYEEGEFQFEKIAYYHDLLTPTSLDVDATFDTVKEKEKARLTQFWEQSLIEVSDQPLDHIIKFNVYSLYHHSPLDGKRSIAAKGISGEGYEGHYFWDTETYMLPYFILTHPSKAKHLLLYRYALLPDAKEEAKNLGATRGAKMPWRTLSGKESSPYYPAGSAQIHINSDVALAYIQYYYATFDHEFMMQYGVELLLETALFYLEYGHFHEGKFHLYGVTGPDEYTAIVNDNYYTNRLAQNHLGFIADYVTKHKQALKPLLHRLNVTDEDLNLMKKASETMVLLHDQTRNILMQDSSFLQKKEWPIESIPPTHFPLLLHFHPLHIYKHQILKQADTVLAMVLLPHEVDDCYKNTVEYYAKRTTHDSSLSRCAYGIAHYRMGQSALGFDNFKSVAMLDFIDAKKHTKHGLHMANAGGSYLMVMLGLVGLTFDKTLTLNPVSQTELPSYRVAFMYQQTHILLEQDKNHIHLTVSNPIWVTIYGQRIHVDQHHSFEVKPLTIKKFKEDLR